MTMFDEAKLIYAKKSLDFEQELLTYSRFGYVYASPQCIILAEVQDDCWFVQFAIGQGCMEKFLQVMPFRLKYVSWRRGLKESNKHIKCELVKLETTIMKRTFYGRR